MKTVEYFRAVNRARMMGLVYARYRRHPDRPRLDAILRKVLGGYWP